MNCEYHPIYRICARCGQNMDRGQERECSFVEPPSERVVALREARALIQQHAMSTWRGGLIERSDGITEVLAEFDQQFPEALT